MTSPFSWISMEGFCSESDSEKPNIESEQIDLTLKLSPCGQNAEEEKMVLTKEGDKGLVRFGDLQTMRRVRTWKRLLLEKMRRAAAEKSLAVSHSIIDNNLKMFANPSGESWHEGGASWNFQTSSPKQKQENDCMVSPKAMQEMTLWPYETKIEKPAKKLKHVIPYHHKSDAMDIVKEMPSVITTGDGSSGKRIEGILYKYKRGQVCIVCACHGSFLSPTEFVMHAGGKEVADPMKHITVSSDSFYINGDHGEAGFITHPF